MRTRAKKARGKDEKLAELISEYNRDYQNYSDSVLILRGLADYFSSTAGPPARFIGTHLPLPLLDNPERQPPRPDLVLQSLDDEVGLCFELKWSLPNNLPLLKSEIVGTVRYCKPRSGWKTSTGTVSKVETFVIAPRDSFERVRKMAEDDEEVDQVLKKNLTLLSWDFSKTTGLERLYVLKVGGTQSSLDHVFASPGLELPKSTMTDTFAKVMFYGAKPPLPYLMEKVYLLANAIRAFDTLKDVEISAIRIRYFKEGIVATAKELYAEQASFFQPWERADQDIPQLRQKWIQEALVGLAQIKLAIPVISLRPLDRSSVAFFRPTTPGWKYNPSQLFFFPSRSRGLGLRYHIIRSYARYKLALEES